MTSTTNKLNIAIVGGGIGGLCLAVALRNHPEIKVQIYEKAADFVPNAGAGMSFWPRVVSVLNKWGLEEKFKAIVTQSLYKDLAFQMAKSNQPTPGEVWNTWEVAGGIHSFHRAHLLQVLYDTLPEGVVHFKKTAVSYKNTEDNKVIVTFGSGDSITCDLLVGCDGLWSTIRGLVYEQLIASGRVPPTVDAKPVWTGSALFRAMLPYAAMQAKYPNHRGLRGAQMYCGGNKRAVCYPMNNRKSVNFGIFFADPSKEGGSYEETWKWQPESEVTKSWLLEQFADWEPEVKQLLSMIEDTVGPPGPTRWGLWALRPLPTYLDGRVLLMGDAAHATTPHWGFGAGSSVEDANVLAELLSQPSVTRSTLPVALEVFDKLRVVEGRRVIEGSRRTGLIYDFNPPQGEDLKACAEAILKETAWIVDTNPEDDVQEALELLRARLG